MVEGRDYSLKWGQLSDSCCGKSIVVEKVNVYSVGCSYLGLVVVVYRMKGGGGEKRKTKSRPT